MPQNEDIKELLRLTKDTNRTIHKMRRSAFWGGIIKFSLYVILLVAAPLWLYATYLAPITEQLVDTYTQVQGTGAKAQIQLSNLQDVLKQFKDQFSTQQ